MDPMMRLGSSLLSEAVVVWTGWCEAPAPVRRVERLVERYGEDLTIELMPLIKCLEADFYTSDVYQRATNDQLADASAREFSARYPELSPEVSRALGWCYSYDWK